MPSDSQYDVIIIGTGAGGGTLAHKLAPSGKRILMLERGDYVPREKDNWSSRAVNVDGKYHTREVWRDKEGRELAPHTNYYVGGNTKFYGAALFRLRKEDFGEVRHHGGVSPAWPIGYDEIEPYYTQAERLYHVHGQRGEDPTEPPASGPYPHPAVSSRAWFTRGCARLCCRASCSPVAGGPSGLKSAASFRRGGSRVSSSLTSRATRRNGSLNICASERTS